jgi:hypothetical protein
VTAITALKIRDLEVIACVAILVKGDEEAWPDNDDD